MAGVSWLTMPKPDSPEMTREVAALLRRWCRCLPVSSIEESRLVAFGAAISIQSPWLRRRLAAATRKEETRIELVARSCVGSLFLRKGPDSDLGVALADVLNASDAELFIQFCRVVTRRVSQELYHRWPETDPDGAKISRNMWRALGHDPRIVIFPADDPIWVTTVKEGDLKTGAEPVDADGVVRLLLELWNEELPMADLLAAVLERIADLPGRSRAVRIDILFTALRQAAQEMRAIEWTSGERVSVDPELRRAIEKSI
ncbi:MAG: hypothetical protein HY304_07400, partial [candidate division Zixibacteria bacterium]|nr:hypothetical protein [candidate division Zixibacteria bacterium]